MQEDKNYGDCCSQPKEDDSCLQPDCDGQCEVCCYYSEGEKVTLSDQITTFREKIKTQQYAPVLARIGLVPENLEGNHKIEEAQS
jgi:hypothetical protein